MKKLLVTYATLAGSTAEVAEAIAGQLIVAGFEVDVLPISQVANLERYHGVVVGGPMTMGWHRAARRFLRRHRSKWETIPLAIFVTCMSLTRTGESRVEGVPVYVDPELPRPPRNAGRLSLRERYANLSSYLRPIIRATRPSKPECIGVFGGRLEYGRLKWWGALFVTLIVQAPAGDRRNWEAINAWAAGLPSNLGFEPDLGRPAEATGREQRLG